MTWFQSHRSCWRLLCLTKAQVYQTQSQAALPLYAISLPFMTFALILIAHCICSTFLIIILLHDMPIPRQPPQCSILSCNMAEAVFVLAYHCVLKPARLLAPESMPEQAKDRGSSAGRLKKKKQNSKKTLTSFCQLTRLIACANHGKGSTSS